MLRKLALRAGLILVVALFAAQPTWARKKKGGDKNAAVKKATDKKSGEKETKKKAGKIHPDYTKGAQLENTDEFWNIGPTGIIGYFWSATTTKQIPVKEILKGAPAEGLIKENDVLVGLDNGRFTNARAELVNAVVDAEKVKGGGDITFNVWRPSTSSGQAPSAGKFLQVAVKVPFMGTYSDTSPWDCPKTERMIEQAVAHILKVGLVKEQLRGQKRVEIVDDLFALGLLATGDPKHLPLVREYAHKVAGPDVIYKRGGRGTSSWFGGYRNIFLTEYYLITKDDHVLPTIKSLSEFIALGVSGVGTWSHGMAAETYGPAGAYGAMNNCSITCSLSLVLAGKCGVKSPAIDKAIRLNINFLNWFIDKGTIPYGDHPGNLKSHDSNGRNSHAAVLYDLFGQKKGAEFLTRMTVASFPKRDSGHTGHFWSGVWGPLGAARGGKEAASAFMLNTKYYTELERRFDGSFIYQGVSKNLGWDCTGARLIAFCLPRKALYITGKGGGVVDPITGDELKDVVAAGSYATGELAGVTFTPPKLSVEELLDALGSWSPVVRDQAGKELGTREEDVVDTLLAMLESPDAYKRYGACVALQYAGRKSEKAVQLLLGKLKDSKDLTMRYHAVSALKLRPDSGSRRGPVTKGLGAAVMVAGPTLLKMASEFDKERDPFCKLNQSIVSMFFYQGRVAPYRGYYAEGTEFEKLDADQVVAAMKAWLTNPNGGTRSGATGVYSILNKEQLEQLWPYIYIAANESAPSGVMFSLRGKQDSMKLLADHDFKEALPMAVAYLVMDGWAKFAAVPAAFDVLSRYGSAVKPYMHFVEFEFDDYKYRKPKEVENATTHYNRLKANLDKDMNLKSIKPYLKAAGIPYKKPDVKTLLEERARQYFGWEVVGKPGLETRKWRYKTLSPKPGKEYKTLNTQNGSAFLDVAAGEGLQDWAKQEFDDSSWKTCITPFGKEPWKDDRFEITARSQWENDEPYLLMRTTIDVDELHYETYRLKIIDTIGVRLYLNGVEIFTPKYYWSKQPKYRPINDKVSGILKKGKNTLAIYANNHNKGPVMVDCYIEGLLKKETFDPTPYYKEEE